jgi:hypothetical protein
MKLRVQWIVTSAVLGGIALATYGAGLAAAGRRQFGG